MPAIHFRPGVEAAPGYRLIEMLGRGGFGEVWKAEGPGGVACAVKVIDKVEDKAGRKEFRALNLVKNIKHPNLVAISGFWLRDAAGEIVDPESLADDHGGDGKVAVQLIVAMDLGEVSLLDRLKECREKIAEGENGGIPLEELLEYMEASAKAIDYLNQKHDVQHRDIKPQNILIVGGSAKICDFGLASTVSSVRTSMGGAGSLAYMAPEVYTSKLPSRTTDQYSLAIAYVELRTGRLPLSDIESYAVLDDAKRNGVLDLTWLEGGEREVIAKAAAIDPQNRYASCIEMVRKLRRATEPGGDQPASTGTSSSPAALVAGDYDLQEQLYRHGGERIWLATSPEGHRVVAVVREPARSPETTDFATLGLVRESTRSHANLAEIFDVQRLNAEGQALPQRLFEGPNPPLPAKLVVVSQATAGNLSQEMTTGGIALRALIDYMRQLAEAVDFINQPCCDTPNGKASIQHGNLRPINFQIDGGKILLGNFASARLLVGDQQPLPEGKKFADNPYLPPEIAQGKLARQSDQYQLAVAYLQMRTGKPASSLTGATRSSRRDVLGKMLDFSSLSDGERTVLEKATSHDPANRYASCQALVDALVEAIPPEAIEEEIRVAPQRPEPQPVQRRDPPSTPKPKGTSKSDSSIHPDMPTLEHASNQFPSAAPMKLVDSDLTKVFEEPKAPAAHGGTMAPPNFGETRMPVDTDRIESEVLPPKRPAAPVRPIAPVPAAKGSIWTNPTTLIGAAAAIGLIAGAVYLFRPKPDAPNPSPSIVEDIDGPAPGEKPKDRPTPPPKSPLAILESQVAKLLAADQFRDAADAVEKTPAIDARNRRRLLDEIGAKWQAKTIAPQLDKLEFAKAIELFDTADPRLFNADGVARERRGIYQAWQGHAEKLRKDNKLIAAVEQWDALLDKQGGPFANAAERRNESLEELYRQAMDKIHPTSPDKEESKQAAAMLGELVSSLDRNRTEAATLPKEFAGRLKNDALLAQARASARADDWQAVADDIESIGSEPSPPYTRPADRAHFALLRLYAPSGQSSERQRLADAQAINLPDLEPWERRLCEKLVEDLNRNYNDEEYKRLVALLGDALKQIEKKDYAAAQKKLAEIRANPSLEKRANASEQRYFEELTAMAALGDGATKSAELTAAAGYAKKWLCDVPPEGPRSKLLATLLVERALRRDKADGPREAPELLMPALRITAKARSLAADESLQKDFEALQTSLIDEALVELRALRDQPKMANPQFDAFLETAKTIEAIVGPTALTIACQIETHGETSPASSASPLFEALRSAEVAKIDQPYVDYVLAAHSGATADEKTAERLFQAYRAEEKPPYRPQDESTDRWRLTDVRRRRAAPMLVKAAIAMRDGPTEDKALQADRYSADKAKAASRYFALAGWMLAGLEGKSGDVLSESQLVDFRVNRVLAIAYGGGTEQEGMLLTDALIQTGQDQSAPTQVMLVNIRLHEAALSKSPKASAAERAEHWNRAVTAYRRLYETCKKKRYPAVVVFGRVVEPAFELISAGAPSEPADEVKKSAAVLCAARGEHLDSGMPIDRELETKLAEVEPAKLVYDSYDKAIEFDPSQPEYFVGRALAVQGRLATTTAEKAAALAQGAKDTAQAAGDEKRWQAAALGVEGLATFFGADRLTDFDKKVEELIEADKQFQMAREQGDASSPEMQRFLIAQGNVYLHLANYSAKRKDRADYLTKARDHAKMIVDTYRNRPRPDEAYQLLGNAEEDFGLFLDDFDGFERAIPHFSEQLKQAELSGGKARQALARMNRGRARYRSVIWKAKAAESQLATLNAMLWSSEVKWSGQISRAEEDVTAARLALKRKPDDAAAKSALALAEKTKTNEEAKRDAELGPWRAAVDQQRKAIETLRRETDGELERALVDLNMAVDDASTWNTAASESNYWIGKIYQPSLRGDYMSAKSAFERAVAAAEENDPAWAYYQLQLAENSLLFGEVDMASGGPTQARDALLEAEAFAAPLLDPQLAPEKANRTDNRHRVGAALATAEGRILLGDVKGAEQVYTQVKELPLSTADAFNLHVGMAQKVFLVAQFARFARSLQSDEAALLRSSLDSAYGLWSKLDGEQKSALYRLNRSFDACWFFRRNDAAIRFNRKTGSKDELIAVQELAVYHLGLATKMQQDAQLKESLAAAPDGAEMIAQFAGREKSFKDYQSDLNQLKGSK